jgi:hypothetical protein
MTYTDVVPIVSRNSVLTMAISLDPQSDSVSGATAVSPELYWLSTTHSDMSRNQLNNDTYEDPFAEFNDTLQQDYHQELVLFEIDLDTEMQIIDPKEEDIPEDTPFFLNKDT